MKSVFLSFCVLLSGGIFAKADAADVNASVSAPIAGIDATTSGAVTAADIAERQAQISKIDKAIELELVRFSRYNIRYDKSTTIAMSKRTYGYAMMREAGTAVGFAGTISELSERARALNDIGKFSKSGRRHALIASATGNAISAESSTVELAQNLWALLQARKGHYSAAESLRTVSGFVKRTDDLFAQRKQLVALETDAKFRKGDELEERLLRLIRQQLLYEYARWSCASRDLAWRENSFFTIDAAQNLLGMSSNLLSLRSFHDPSRSGAAAIMLLIANSAATLNPPISVLGGVYIRRHHLKALQKRFPCARPESSDALSSDELDELKHSSRRAKIYEEVAFLSANAERMDKNIDGEVAEIDRLRQVAQQQLIAGPIIGLTSVARSILVTTAYYGYREDKTTANRLLFPGRISQATGQAYALWDTPYTMFKGMRRTRRLRSEGKLPSQILEARLKRLDLVEEHINGPSHNP